MSEVENKIKPKPNPVNPTVTISPLFFTSGSKVISKEVIEAYLGGAG